MPKAKAPEQRASAQEKALAQIAVRKDQRHEEAFRPLEQAAISELDTADAGKRSAMVAGRQNADLEQQAASSKAVGLRADATAGTFGSGATTSRGFRRAGAAESGRTAIKTGADQTARDSIDADTLNVIKTGQGMARQTQSALTGAARRANLTARSELDAQALKDQARANAVGEVATAAVVAGKSAYDKAFGNTVKTGENRVDRLTGTMIPGGKHTEYTYGNSELNSFQKGLRQRFGG